MTSGPALIVELFSFYGIKCNKQYVADTCSAFPAREELETISFYLFTENISSRIFTVSYPEMQEINYPLILELVSDRGDKSYLHFHNGTFRYLYPGSVSKPVNKLDNDPGRRFRALAFDHQSIADQHGTAQRSISARQGFGKLVQDYMLTLLIICVLAGLLYFLWKKPAFHFTVGIGSLFSLFVSLILHFKETGVLETVTHPFCGKENYLGCSRLLRSPFSKTVFQLSWAQIGLFNFTALLLFIVSASVKASDLLLVWLLVNALGSVMMIIKMYRIKVFCKLCLSIHTANFLVLALVLLFSKVDYPLDIMITDIIRLASALVISALVVFWLCVLLKKLKDTREQAVTLKIFKRALLEKELAQTDHTMFSEWQAGFSPLCITGSEEAATTITLILSLECNHCAAVIDSLVTNRLINHLSAVNIYLYVPGDEDELVRILLKNLSEMANDKSGGILLTLQKWYAGTYAKAVMKHADQYRQQDSQPSFCLSESAMRFAEFPVIFINNNLLSTGYSGADLPFIIYLAAQLEEE